jgi:hypothetical protein
MRSPILADKPAAKSSALVFTGDRDVVILGWPPLLAGDLYSAAMRKPSLLLAPLRKNRESASSSQRMSNLAAEISPAAGDTPPSRRKP